MWYENRRVVECGVKNKEFTRNDSLSVVLLCYSGVLSLTNRS